MGALELKLKEVIPCPGCKKSLAYVYADTKGHSSVRCYRCKIPVLIDYALCKAVIIPPVKRFNRKSIPS